MILLRTKLNVCTKSTNSCKFVHFPKSRIPLKSVHMHACYICAHESTTYFTKYDKSILQKKGNKNSIILYMSDLCF